jgi:hypothetical protein
MRIQPLPADTGAPRAPGLYVAGTRVTADAPKVGAYDAAALLAVLAFVFYVAIALYGAGGRSLALTFPVGCLVVGLITYVRSPATYLAFTWWTWLLTPLLRRIFDLKYGFHSTSPLLLGPLLATAVALFTVVRRRRMLRSSAYIPFTIASAALAYAFLIGVIRQSPSAASYDLLTWLSPLIFGLHLALEWRQFPRLRVMISGCVLWGLAFVSVYAIWQFIDPPIWDRAWVVNAEMQSVGAPLPFVIRVFSTLNAPGPFSIMLVFALLFGLAAPQRWRALPLAIGLVALILTKGRSAWGAFFLGAIVLQLRQPLRSLPRQWVALFAVILLAAPVITQPRVMSVLTGRAATLRNVEQDHSFQSRLNFTRYALNKMSTNPAGSGLGNLGGASKLLTGSNASFAFDSGPLEVYGVMGWLGGTLYMMALFAIILPIVRGRRVKYDPITGAAVAAVVALLATSLFGNIFNSVSGFFLWSAVGIATAGRTYASAVELMARYPTKSGLSSAA